MTGLFDEIPAATATGELRAVRCEAPGCGRLLTDPESVLHRRGPYCRVEDFAARGFAVEQDALPGF